jgi:hypothetical protein
MPRFVKGSKEASDYMKMIRSKKKGSGIFDSIKSMAKSGAKSLVQMGADKLKDTIGSGMKKKKGKGIIGDVARFGTSKLIDMTGLGVRVNAPGRLLKGAALVNAGY